MTRRSNRRDEEGSGFKVILTILLIALLIILGIIGYRFWQYKDAAESYEALDSFMKTEPEKMEIEVEASNMQMQERAPWPDLEIDADALKAVNPDFRFVLYFPLLDIKYPVVYPEDNEKYLKTSFDLTSSITGCLFVDARNSDRLKDRNTIIYGHNMRDGSMFGNFRKLLQDSTFIDQDPYFWLYFDGEVRKYEVFAFYTTTPDSGAYIVPKSDDAYDSFVKAAQSRSLNRRPVDLSNRPDVITLSTCYGTDHQYFTVVQGALVATYKTN